MDRVKLCLDVAQAAWSRDRHRKVLNPSEARKALCLFWELQGAPSLREDFDALQIHVFPEGMAPDWLEAEDADQEFLSRERHGLSPSQLLLLRCIVQCRVIDHCLAAPDPLLSAGIEVLAQQPVLVTVEVPVDCRFLPKDDARTPGACFADFRIIPRAHNWPRIDRALGQGHFLRLVIRNHIIVPCHAVDYRIDLKVPPADRSPALFQTPYGAAVVATAHVHAGLRDWPAPGDGPLLGFNPDTGIHPANRADEILCAIDDHFQAGANLIVMPELSLCAQTALRAACQLREAAKALPTDAKSRLSLIGTAHVLDGGKEPKQRNRAFLLWGDGSEALVQDKLKGMVVPKFVEDIKGATDLTLLLTPFGPLCVLICKDFCDAFLSGPRELASMLDIGVVLVPSMGEETTISAHEGALKMEDRVQGAAVIIAQQAGSEYDAKSGAYAEHFVAMRGEEGLKRGRSKGRGCHHLTATLVLRQAEER